MRGLRHALSIRTWLFEAIKLFFDVEKVLLGLVLQDLNLLLLCVFLLLLFVGNFASRRRSLETLGVFLLLVSSLLPPLTVNLYN